MTLTLSMVCVSARRTWAVMTYEALRKPNEVVDRRVDETPEGASVTLLSIRLLSWSCTVLWWLGLMPLRRSLRYIGETAKSLPPSAGNADCLILEEAVRQSKYCVLIALS